MKIVLYQSYEQGGLSLKIRPGFNIAFLQTNENEYNILWHKRFPISIFYMELGLVRAPTNDGFLANIRLLVKLTMIKPWSRVV